MNDLKNALRTALVTRFGADPGTLDDHTGLFSTGIIDSLSVMDLVCFVESQIGHPVPATAITLENFDSIARIVAFAQTRGGTEKDS